MNVFISTIRDKNDNILKYRILNTSNGSIKDIGAREIERLEVRNLKETDKFNKIQCLEGSISDYPIITNGSIKNNIPVVIKSLGGSVTIANFEGKVVTFPIEVIIQKINKFANMEISSGRLVKKAAESVVKADSEKGGSEKGGSEKGGSEKGGSGKSITALEEILKSPEVNINLQGFHMADHYKKLGISELVFKKPGELFKDRNKSREQVENNPNAYSFDIVKIEDRVELRGYKGIGYKGLVEIPDKVTHICKEAFKDAEATELKMTETVVYLGDYAFLKAKFKRVSLSSKVTAIPFACFKDSELEEINMDKITSIDNLAFCKCNIKEIKLKSAVVQIGFEAFKDCKYLEVFEHNKTIKKVRHHAFENCINLTNFDFETVMTIEQHAFSKTGIKRARINGEVNYLQSDTFTGNIEEIELLEGMYKISANAVSNIENKPIVWTVPKSVTNIEKGAFKKQDTVMCYRKSVAASSAIISESQLIYLDDMNRGSIPSVIRKANMLDISIEEILKDSLKLILEKDSISDEYEIDETRAVRADIPQEILDIVGRGFTTEKYATEADIAGENIKFKCILEHLYKVAVLDATPFSSTIIKLKDTINVQRKKGKLEVLYEDEKSSVYRLVYTDNKFLSVNSSFIVAKTYDTLRYICMENKYTDIMCENADTKDLKSLFRVLSEGDTIGLNSVISGVKYPEIAYESDKEIELTRNGSKYKRKIKMNLYQALRYSSVTIKLDNNNIALLLPGNKKVIKCASLGKTVWMNEKEDTYKSLQCTIESIEDIGSDTVFDYASTSRSSNYGTLLKRFKQMKPGDYQDYIESYSHIYKAEQSMYKHAGDYAYRHRMKELEDVDIKFIMTLFQTSLFEERKEEWLESSIGKTIVEDAEHSFELSDGSELYQYRVVRKTALRNKLMSGGDRKLYVFELINNSGIRVGVYISLYDIRALVKMCIEINEQSKSEDKRIFIEKGKFDIVDGVDVIEISGLCRDNKFSIRKTECEFILAVYKPNGIYYIGVKLSYGKTFRFMPIIQVGELDVALEFIEDTNKYGLSNESMGYLYSASIGAISYYFEHKIGEYISITYSKEKYLSLLKARDMCITGISSITEYNKLGIQEILKRCLGYNDTTVDIYKVPEMLDIDEEEYSVEFDIDEAELFLGDDEFDIDEEELGDI